MKSYYLYKIDSEIDTFSHFEAGVNFKFYTTTLDSHIDFEKDDLLIGYKEPCTYYLLKVIDFQHNGLSLTKLIEVSSDYKIPFKKNHQISPLDKNEYEDILENILVEYRSKLDVQDETINTLEDFIDWFIKRNGGPHNYFTIFFSDDREKLKKELEKYEKEYEGEFKDKIFTIPNNDIESVIRSIKENLKKKGGSFFEFSDKKSNHMPRAILGTRNYLAFLKEKYTQTENLPQVPFEHTSFENACENAKLIYTSQLITRFVGSLLTKPFVILTGLSGSGKTKLAQAFAQWICLDENQYRIVPVGADWTNREPLLGYVNALKPEEYVIPENSAVELVIEANKEINRHTPYFLILDEMNLSHVERYFADFLSVMESKDKLKLHSADEPLDGGDNIMVDKDYFWPKNLFVIGTVNIDETTNMFSPKVLDRANTIEFRINDGEMKGFLNSMSELNMEALYMKGASMAESFLKLSKNRSFTTKDTDLIKRTLLKFFGEMKKTGAEFGYRSATEIMQLIHQLHRLDATLSTDGMIDIAIMQKLLPKLHGSRRKLCPILEVLGSFCVKSDIKVIKDVFENEDFNFEDINSVQYPLSLEKIARMYRGAIDNGFTSYAEA